MDRIVLYKLKKPKSTVTKYSCCPEVAQECQQEGYIINAQIGYLILPITTFYPIDTQQE